jgi:hypothetical protein
MKTELKTKLTKKKFLTKALTELGFQFTEAKEDQTLTTVGNYSVHEKVDILIESNGNQNYNKSIGFRKEADGTYTAVGDFFNLKTADGKRVSENMLKCEVTGRALESEVNERLGALSFMMDKSTRVENDEKLSFELRRWVE